MRRFLASLLLFNLFGCLIPDSARADTPTLLHLPDVLAEAKERNLKIMAGRQKWEADRAKLVVARSPSDPKVGVNLEKIRRNKGPRSKNAGTDMYMIEQEIPFPGKLSARGRAQHHASLITLYEFRRTVQDVLMETVEAYYDYWELTENMRITRGHARILERFSNVSERQYASSKTTQRDVLRTQVEADKILIELENLEERLPAARTRLNILLNRPADAALPVPASPVVSRMTLSIPTLDSSAEVNNVDLKSARHHVEHSRYVLKDAKLSFFPDLTAGWARMVEDGMPKVYNASVFLNVPFFYWKQRAQVRAAASELRHAEFESERMLTELKADIRTAAAIARNTARSEEIYKKSILPRSRKALEISESSYLSGRAGFLDLLDAQRELLNEELAYARILAEHGKSRAALDRILGTIDTQNEKGGEHRHE